MYIALGLQLKVEIDSEVLEVKVPLLFLSTGGFSLRRERRYQQRWLFKLAIASSLASVYGNEETSMMSVVIIMHEVLAP